MKIHCPYDKLVNPKELRPNPKNPNTHDKDQIDRLCKILEYQGWRYPIKVSKQSGFISSGHGRLAASLKLNLKEVPVSYQDYENEDQEYADLVSDNAIASWSNLDLSQINLEVPNLVPDFNIDHLGIKDFTIDMSEKGLCDEDEVPETVEPISKRGDLYLLGDHRLLCGDSTDILQVERLMNGKKADMVFTDPPYGMNLDTDFESIHSSNIAGSRTNRPVIGDSEPYDPNPIFTIEAKEVFIWGADYFCQKIPNGGSWIVWDKRESENMDKVHGSTFELCWSKQKHKKLIYRKLWIGFQGMKKDDGLRIHPTQKPIELITWFFEQWGNVGETVIDIYGGSGSTLIACEKTNRKCFMMEIDPHYCDVIVARWEKYTGKKAELIESERDPSPWCSYGHKTAKECDCGPIAAND